MYLEYITLLKTKNRWYFFSLVNTRHLKFDFQVKNCGTDFRWSMFGITSKDADNLGAGLKICKKLRILKIYNSKMDDDKFYSVFDGIKNLTGLEILNFQNNMMTDESAETMVKLISGQPHLKKLDLTNNRFGCRQSCFINSCGGRFLWTWKLGLFGLVGQFRVY